MEHNGSQNWLKNRYDLVYKCETFEGQFFYKILKNLQQNFEEYNIITHELDGMYGFIWNDLPVDVFNRIMGNYMSYHAQETVFKELIKQISGQPIYISCPPINDNSILDLIYEYDLFIDSYQSIFMTNLEEYNLDTYNQENAIRELTKEDINTCATMYLNEIYRNQSMLGTDPTSNYEDGVEGMIRDYYSILFEMEQVNFYGYEYNDNIVAISGIFYDDNEEIGYLFSDLTIPEYRNRGIQTALIIYRGLEHQSDVKLLFGSIINTKAYISSIGNAFNLQASHLYDRSLFVYDPSLYM